MQDKINRLTDRAIDLMARGKRKAALKLLSRVGAMRAAMWRK